MTCPRCGHQTNGTREGDTEHCTNCGGVLGPAVTVESVETLDDTSESGKFQNLMDGESVIAAKAFLECNFSQGFNHGFTDAGSVLSGFRAFAADMKRYQRLPAPMQIAKAFFPGMVAGSWGHYAATWIRRLQQADNSSELIDEVTYEFKQYGFLPQDYTP